MPIRERQTGRLTLPEHDAKPPAPPSRNAGHVYADGGARAMPS